MSSEDDVQISRGSNGYWDYNFIKTCLNVCKKKKILEEKEGKKF